jgi:drug/metabolite transporter (DMT)-like permease
MSKGAWYMLLSLFAFSFMHLLVKFLPHLPVSEIIFFRSLFALVISIWMLKQQKIYAWGNRKLLLVLRGVAGVVSLFTFFYTIHHMPLASAITITNVAPFFAMFLSVVFLKEKIGKLQWLFVSLSFVGVYIIKGYDTRIGFWYLLVALVAAFFTATAHFLVRYLRDTEHESVIIFYFPLVSLPLVFIPMLQQWVTPHAWDYMILLGIGISTQIGQVYLTKAYRTEDIGSLSGLYFIGLLFALFYGYIFFSETYTWISIIGMLVVAFGAMLGQWYKSRKAV